MQRMRSWLFAPGDSEKKMARAADGPADVVLLDLEDSVSPEMKPAAREMVRAFLASRDARKARTISRAAGFISGETESSRSRRTTSAGPSAALAIFFSLSPGANSHERIRCIGTISSRGD